jgi:hypothetical protein
MSIDTIFFINRHEIPIQFKKMVLGFFNIKNICKEEFSQKRTKCIHSYIFSYKFALINLCHNVLIQQYVNNCVFKNFRFTFTRLYSLNFYWEVFMGFNYF